MGYILQNMEPEEEKIDFIKCYGIEAVKQLKKLKSVLTLFC